MTSSVVGLRRSSKALPKARRAPKKGHGHSLVVSCSPDPLQLSEFQWNHYIWEVCSADGGNALETAMPAAGMGQQNGPNSSPQQRLITCYTAKASEVEQIGLWHFALSSMFTWPLTNLLQPLQKSLQLFAGKTLKNQEAGNAFQEFVKSQSMDFYATGINKLTSHWQSMLIAMVPILTNEDVFEPSYNDLKSMDQNCNYFCTNLTVYQC